MTVRVLVVAGSDSSGGAGIQADIKTVMALGGYATTAITALTAQNTVSVAEVFEVDPFFVEAQMRAVLDDIGADAIKIGMLFSAQTAELVARQCESKARSIPIVLDPLLRSTSGTELLSLAGRKVMVARLLPLAALVTPNVEEASLLTGRAIESVDDMKRAADRFLLMGASAVLIKGGHLGGETVVDVLRTLDGEERCFESPRIESKATHGTGCTLASAIATLLGHGLTLESAVAQARRYLGEAMTHAVPLGRGNGPLNHAWMLPKSHEPS